MLKAKEYIHANPMAIIVFLMVIIPEYFKGLYRYTNLSTDIRMIVEPISIERIMRRTPSI